MGENKEKEGVTDWRLLKPVCGVAGIRLSVCFAPWGEDKESMGGDRTCAMWLCQPALALPGTYHLNTQQPHIRAYKHTLQYCPVSISQGKPDRFLIKCAGVLSESCMAVSFGPACMHGVRACSPLASFPPDHHMQGWEPRLAPSVRLMPSLSPKQLAPTSFIILTQTHTHTNTHKHSGDTHAARGRRSPSYNEKNHQRLRRCFWNEFWLLVKLVSDEYCLHEFNILNGQTGKWARYQLTAKEEGTLKRKRHAMQLTKYI